MSTKSGGQLVDLVVPGAITYDEIYIPSGELVRTIGGSAVHSALGARLAGRVAPLSVIGDDFDETLLEPLQKAGIALEGVERAVGETFRWGCRYDSTGDQRQTLYTRPGVYETHMVTIAPSLLDAPLVFLTAGNPLQNEAALAQLQEPRVIALDTIEREIETHREGLMRLMARAQILSINAHEAAMLIGWTGGKEDERLPRIAAAELRGLGPETILIKRASQGVEVFERGRGVHVSAVPGIRAVDPTGAGDAFSGALLSVLARGCDLIAAARWGCAVASFTVEGYGIAGALRATFEGVRARLASVWAEERPA